MSDSSAPSPSPRSSSTSLGERDPAGEVDGPLGLLVGGEDLGAHRNGRAGGGLLGRRGRGLVRAPFRGSGPFGVLGARVGEAGAHYPGPDAARLGGAVVGGHDLAHDAVADDVGLAEMDERDPLDLAEQLLELEQARSVRRRRLSG